MQRKMKELRLGSKEWMKFLDKQAAIKEKKRQAIYRKLGLAYPPKAFSFEDKNMFPYCIVRAMATIYCHYTPIFVSTRKDAGYKGEIRDIYIYLSSPHKDKKGRITKSARQEIIDGILLWAKESSFLTWAVFSAKDILLAKPTGELTTSTHPVATIKLSPKKNKK